MNTEAASNTTSNVLLSPGSNKSSLRNKQLPSFEQVVPITELLEKDASLNEKAAKAYEFLKEETQTSKSVKTPDAKKVLLATVKEDSRMQAYGWSLPSKSSISLSSEAAKAATPITVPVPVYCRPLFEHDNNLKMCCASTINFDFDAKCVKDCGELIEASAFSHFKSANQQFKSSCIWIANLNENDTHVSILDANKPGDLVEQFILKYLKIYCIKSVAGKSMLFSLS